MLRRLGKGRSPLSRSLRGLLARSAESGVLTRSGWPRLRVTVDDLGADSIERHLAEVLGTDVRVGVILGTARSNQKPVLQVFAPTGEVIGYAKIGHTPVTRSLVRQEAATLQLLTACGTTSFRAPQALSASQWRGLQVLVVSPLGGSPGREVSQHTRVAAMRELAAVQGLATCALADSPFWSRLGESLHALEPAAERLRRAYDVVTEQHGGVEVRLGAWHGDWGHWNMALQDGVVQLWDWERFDPSVPLGFDEIHFHAQGVRPGTRHFAARQQRLVADVPQLLTPFGIEPVSAQLTFRLYLLEVSARYAAGMSQAPTPALGRRLEWSTSLLEQLTGGATVPVPRGGRS
jgi:hypothetical protein